MIKFKGYGFSDQGKQRKNNEDHFVVDNDLGLYILCDGVGGHNSGEVASQTCTAKVHEFILKSPQAIQQYQAAPTRENREKVGQLVHGALQYANSCIHEASQKNASNEGMATTAEVLLLLKDYAVLGHVGDSRTFLVRGDAAHQLTEDHSYGNEMIKKGAWDAATAEKSPYRDNLTRAVGIQPAVQADLLEIELTQGDTFVLCSDGLHGYLRANEIHRFTVENFPGDLAWQLVSEANNRGGRDNITVVVTKIEQIVHETARPADAPKKQQAIGKVPLFMYLSFAEMNKILALSAARTLKAGDILCREGENPEEMFVLVSGEAVVKKGEQKIATLKPGASVGEMGIIDSLPRSATVQAVDNITVLSIGKHDFIQLLKQDPSLAVKILWAMGLELDRRLRSTSRDLAEARSLIEKAKKSDLPFDVR